ncbi:Hypothetical protein PHPALM_19648 [Phytophthora palmivora]|uniref:Uncharacterized protein n=1 Tax=Phytophthora palmivora TaxID=4796 RepID=A0A2P4XGV8_9STRA|nr:Hypothetical protein PHPALM_19648 [Phytophthora palmivora]
MGKHHIGYFFFLRRSEFLKIGNPRRFYCLKTNNAFFSDDNGRRVARDLATSDASAKIYRQLRHDWLAIPYSKAPIAVDYKHKSRILDRLAEGVKVATVIEEFYPAISKAETDIKVEGQADFIQICATKAKATCKTTAGMVMQRSSQLRPRTTSCYG